MSSFLKGKGSEQEYDIFVFVPVDRLADACG